MLRFVDGEPMADRTRIGAVGYCMSGPFVVWAAAAFPDRLRCIASIYGANLVTDEPDSAHRMLDNVRCEAYFACAETDKWAPPAVVAELESALAAAGTKHRLEWYPGAEHGFAFPLRAGIYHKPSAERHWNGCSTSSGATSRRRRHCRGVVIDDPPASVPVMKDKAESRRADDLLAIAGLRERVRSGVDGDVAVDANALLSEHCLVGRRNGAQDVEVLANRFRLVAQRRRPSAPEDGLGVVERHDALRIVATHALDPASRDRRDFGFRRLGRWDGLATEQKERGRDGNDDAHVLPLRQREWF
jgi:hypothetical protein